MTFDKLNVLAQAAVRRSNMCWSLSPSPSIDGRLTPSTCSSSVTRDAEGRTKPSSKMSLDFLCEGLSSQQLSSPSTSCSEYDRMTPESPTQLQLPNFDRIFQAAPINENTISSISSPAWSTYSDTTPFIPPPTARAGESLLQPIPRARPKPRRHRETRRQARQGFARPPTPPRTPRTRSRSERVQYDMEEMYALIYYREQGLEWGDVLQKFRRLFPVDTPRRCHRTSGPLLRRTSNAGSTDAAIQGRHLPAVYVERSIGALECRWYRIRDQEGMPRVRELSGGRLEMSETRRVTEKEVLEKMENRRMVSQDFLRLLHGDTVGVGGIRAVL